MNTQLILVRGRSPYIGERRYVNPTWHLHPIRDEEVLHEGKVSSLKRFKDDAKEVKEGMECGIGVEEFSKFKEGDEIVVYEIQEVKRTLESA